MMKKMKFWLKSISSIQISVVYWQPIKAWFIELLHIQGTFNKFHPFSLFHLTKLMGKAMTAT